MTGACNDNVHMWVVSKFNESKNSHIDLYLLLLTWDKNTNTYLRVNNKYTSKIINIAKKSLKHSKRHAGTFNWLVKQLEMVAILLSLDHYFSYTPSLQQSLTSQPLTRIPPFKDIQHMHVPNTVLPWCNIMIQKVHTSPDKSTQDVTHLLVCLTTVPFILKNNK